MSNPESNFDFVEFRHAFDSRQPQTSQEVSVLGRLGIGQGEGGFTRLQQELERSWDDLTVHRRSRVERPTTSPAGHGREFRYSARSLEVPRSENIPAASHVLGRDVEGDVLAYYGSRLDREDDVVVGQTTFDIAFDPEGSRAKFEASQVLIAQSTGFPVPATPEYPDGGLVEREVPAAFRELAIIVGASSALREAL